ncbi:MobC family plasmid mobilization relaxosome protein [Gluconacetobacter entanii]|uniref:MobC family plasmid mobilization relaxosome protein n=1 Tax=Gluconacetobacter entanii TaxID=108528 RepID=A0ABT3K236_9PROT|nr:MobC family plasmid mobilization relaxosome protein [Gluconacetobacter entanii]MCW4589457.1 MobC family plasmid mobilization relaxosome protein [Gluconacetobacter entanii]MCW4593157.1 MobC family plasmid mobilization relaxosome protein [Gluconacetobacter entanii]NPC90304.1 plasmid mobilization relaxosome protein MobC [Gluconacetobacter entanii]
MRKETIHIRITDDEKRELMTFAKASNHKNLSTWTRHIMTESMALGKHGTDLIHELENLRREVNSIGNNVNQIAKKLNQGETVDADLSEIKNINKDIRKILKQIRPTRHKPRATV